MMRVTVCELPDERSLFADAWSDLVQHVGLAHSDLLVLNELPFDEWFGTSATFDDSRWRSAVERHDHWLGRMTDLTASAVVLSAPTGTGDGRRNTGLFWSRAGGVEVSHDKMLLPDEDPVWEATWYRPGTRRPGVVQVGVARAGLLICSELWAMEWASQLGNEGAQLLVTPRATGADSTEKWIAAGQVAAVTSGCYSLSSNRYGGPGFGGVGWIIDPDGEVIARTAPGRPAVTVDIDLERANAAKHTYPRYVLWSRPSPGRPAWM